MKPPEPPDEHPRERFMALPTNFYLPKKAVDELIEVAPTLLGADPAYQRLLRDLSEPVQ